MIGKTLAHYEITSQLGKGGMGEVYRAKDQKLGRDVAIKVLPDEFAKDADRIARFQREAKLLASLNHPNIAAIYGLEESDGSHFLVLELIEGDTLADLIKRGPIPVEESLKLALQMAEALEAAHEKGVIHRDLKPANIKVTPDRKVKVLDFGLAKAFAGEQAEVNLSHSPTLSEAATMQGVILGTAAYMSPEQARGKPVDKRTDIWAFGCVLYEMLTGKAAFLGEDVTEILAAVVKSGVNMELLPGNIHPRVREAIIRCLQKDQRKRYGGIGEAQYEIEQVLADPGGLFAQPGLTAKPRKKLRVGIPWLAAAVVLSLIVAGVAVWYLKPAPAPEPGQVVRFTYELPDDQQFNQSYDLAVSPDGKQLVYATTSGLYLHSMDRLDSRLITGTDGNSIDPSFSPDSQWISYWSSEEGKLKKAAVSGGVPISLCDTSKGISSANWMPDGTIVYSDILEGGIKRISADGGTPETLIKMDFAKVAETGIPLISQMLPDGKTILFIKVSSSDPSDRQIVVQSLETGKQKVLLKDILWGSYLPDGYLVYGGKNSLYAVRFDLATLEIKGGSVPVIEGVLNGPPIASRTLVYIPGTRTAPTLSMRTLVWVNRQGKEEPLAAKPDAYWEPRISPDGDRVALAVDTEENDSDIRIYDLVRKTMTPLAFEKGLESAPVWSPDGKRIAFLSTREGAIGGIYWKAGDGTGAVEHLGSSPDGRIIPWSWSKAAKILLYIKWGLSNQTDIGMMSLEGDRTQKSLLHDKYAEYYPQLSPDGRWMAYQSNESGQEEVYVRPFPDVDKERWTISNSGGFGPLWSPDGRELFYWSGDAVMAVSVDTEPVFKPKNPKVLFRGNYYSEIMGDGIHLANWDISPDGKRFLMVRQSATDQVKSKPGKASEGEPAAAGPRKITIVLNWYEELKKQLPAP